MSRTPWVKFFPSDFLNGIMDLNAEETGAYTVLLALIWDRGGAIPDDPAWFARRAGMSTRRWGQVRARLIQLGKVEAHDGLLSNRRALSIVQERTGISEKRAEAANERWGRDAGQNNLFGKETAENSQSSDAIASKPAKQARGGLSPEKTRIMSKSADEIISQETAENSENSDAIASNPSRARPRPRSQNIITTDQHRNPSHARAREADRSDVGAAQDDLLALTQDCCQAAGLSARIAARPALLSQSMDIVRGWMAAGIDIRKTAIPVIQSKVLEATDPAHSLARFSAAVDTRHARERLTVEKTGAPAQPVAVPVYEFPDESPEMEAFRVKLAETVSARLYAQWCEAVRFVIADQAREGDRQILNVERRGRGSAAWTPQRIFDQHGRAIERLAVEMLGVSRSWAR